MKTLNRFMFMAFLIISSMLQASEDFISLHAADLDKKIKSAAKLVVYDANLDSTRKFVGIIKGAHLLSSASDYDVQKELPPNKKTHLIFYCANNLCTASHTAAKRALAAGYKNVSVMIDGIYGWKKAGLPLAQWSPPNDSKVKELSTPSPSDQNEIRAFLPKEALDLVNKKDAFIVDVREEEERHQIIKDSLWFPMSKVKEENEWLAFRTQLPSRKTIIFHCAAGKRAKKVAALLSQEGVKTGFFEGPDQWEKAGLPLEKGPAK